VFFGQRWGSKRDKIPAYVIVLQPRLLNIRIHRRVKMINKFTTKTIIWSNPRESIEDISVSSCWNTSYFMLTRDYFDLIRIHFWKVDILEKNKSVAGLECLDPLNNSLWIHTCCLVISKWENILIYCLDSPPHNFTTSLSLYLFINLSIYLHTYQSIYLIYLSINHFSLDTSIISRISQHIPMFRFSLGSREESVVQNWFQSEV